MTRRNRLNHDEFALIYGPQVIARPPMPPAVRNATHHGIAIEYGRSEVQRAHIRSFECVASEGMQAIGNLSREEAFWVRQVPHAAPRMQAVADIAAMTIANMVSDAGRY